MGSSNDSWFAVVAKAGVISLLFYWAYVMVSQDQPWTLLDAATLVFHEAGHFILFWFGEFISYLGGTLMQLLIPITVFVYFMLKRAYFSAAFGLYWLGSSLINTGVYIKDARSMTLDLIGGEHDWQFILGQMNLLDQDYLIGGFVDRLGTVIVVFALVWMTTDILINTVQLIVDTGVETK